MVTASRWINPLKSFERNIKVNSYIGIDCERADSTGGVSNKTFNMISMYHPGFLMKYIHILFVVYLCVTRRDNQYIL